MSLDAPPASVECRDGHRLRGDVAFEGAQEVYDGFSSSNERVEALARLSIAYTTRFVSLDLKQLLTIRSVSSLESGCFVDKHASPGSSDWLTTWGIVAVNMVKADLDGEDVDAQLSEPFKGLTILPKLRRSSSALGNIRNDAYVAGYDPFNF